MEGELSTPEALADFMKDADARGCQVFIGGAGGAAHLAGVIASKTVKPVLGIPMTSALDGLDSLLATVQMPGGIPVATVAIGKAGAINAGVLAAQILAVAWPGMKTKVKAYKRRLRTKVAKGNRRIASLLKEKKR